MSSKTRLALILSAATLVTLAVWAGPSRTEAAMTEGSLVLRSAGPLAFAPDGMLLVGDSQAAAVYAVDLGEADAATSAENLRISDFDEKVAALVGTRPRDLLFQDMAVHPRSRNIYFSVSRGRGDDAKPVLVKVTPAGEISAVSLEKVRFAKAEVLNAPDLEAKDRRGRPIRTLTITDLAVTEGQVFVAGLSNEEFASNLRRIPYPFEGGMTATSVEIFHGAHGRYETHAPIRTLTPFDVDEKAHLLAAYTCTPLVTFPVDKLIDGEHLKGKTVAELGNGNTPLDLVPFEHEGESLVLVTNTNRAGMVLRGEDIGKAGSITAPVETTTEGVPFRQSALGGVLHVADYDEENLVMLRRDVKSGALELRLRNKGWI